MESQLARVLEPEVMDTEEESVAYDRMDHSEVNRLLVDRFLELGAGGRILDLGTGPAHVPVLLASRRPDLRIVAVDAAESMLRIGAEHVARAGCGERVELLLADAKRLPLEDRSFDAVLSNSIVHHIPDPLPFFREVARVVKPSGAILLRDLRRPRDEAELHRLVALHAAGADDRQRGLFRDSLHAAFTVSEIAALLARAGLEDLEVTATSDRHWSAVRRAATN
jgi:ubiquinone/menaquinone biosynthesis C-methylase UbiE